MGLKDVKNALLLPPNVLNSQICMECLNYLSVGPVMITKDQKILCGRCVQTYKNHDGLKFSMYNKVAEACVFSCVNHYDGCNENLFFNEALKHESKCVGKTYRCPICSYQGNSCQFIQHYKRQHPQQHLSNAEFGLNLSNAVNEELLLYYDIHYIFLIMLVLKHRVLRVSVKILNVLPDRSDAMRYNVRFFKRGVRLEYHTEPRRYLSEKNESNVWCVIYVRDLRKVSTSELRCQFNAILDTAADLEDQNYDMKRKYLKWEENVRERECLVKVEEVKLALEKQSLEGSCNVIKNIVNLFYRSSFNCVNCNTVIDDKLYILVCPQGHISCPNCLKTYCNVCKADCTWTNCKTLLQDMELHCDWYNCMIKTNINKFVFHKQICQHRQYKCPLDNCDFEGTKKELVLHWHSDIVSLKFGKTVDFKSNDSIDIYWIIEYFQELLHVNVMKQPKGHVSLTVHEDVAVFPNNYVIELRYFVSKSNRYELMAKLTQSGASKIYGSSISGHPDWRLIVNSK